MKQSNILAPASLIAASILFVATLPFADSFVGGLLHAFAEASMVGGLADWFAVVALFRHPLGIPIPHTGILLRQRAKMTAGIIDMVQNTWLGKESIQERIRQWRILDRLVHAAKDPVIRQSLRRMLQRMHEEARKSLSADIAATSVVAMLRERVSAAELVAGSKHLMEFAFGQNVHQAILTRILPGSSAWLQSSHVRDLIAANLRKASEDYASSGLRKLGKVIAERSNLLDYHALADSIVRAICEEAEDVLKETAHPLRLALDDAIRDMLSGMGDDEALLHLVDEIRATALSSPALVDTATRLIDQLDTRLGEDLAREDSALMRFLFTLLDNQLERIANDPALAAAAEQWLQERIIAFVGSNHDEIGTLVRHSLEKLDDAQLVAQIEAKVGKDLQYIRVNGAVVGGLVGAILYLLTHALS